MHLHRVFRIISAAVTLAGLVAAGSLCRNLIQRESAELRRTSEAEAVQIASRFQAGILTALEPIEALGRWWLSQGQPEAREDWRTDAQLFLTKAVGLRQAFWVDPNGYQRWAATPEGDPVIARVQPVERIREVIASARTRHAITTSNVFDDEANAKVLYICFPFYSGRRLQGYALGLYDSKMLLTALARSGVRHDHRITVSLDGQQVYASSPNAAAVFQNAVSTFDLAQHIWTVNLGVPLNYFREFRGLIFTVAGVVGALVYSFSTLLYFSQRHSLALYRANTEIRDLNRDLQRKVVDFQTLLEVSPVGIAVAEDAECRSVRANPALAKILGVPPDANISRISAGSSQSSWRITRNGRELRAEELPLYVAAATGKGVIGDEERIVRADGTEVDVLSFAAPVFDEHGQVRGALNACVDISERKAQERVRRDLERDLQRAQRMKSLGVMAAGIAHDFNNLLTSIIGRATLAADSLPPGSEAYQHITASLESGLEAARLIGQVMAYTGRAHQKRRSTDVGRFITDLYPQLQELASGRAKIHLAIAPELPPVMAAQDEVRHIFHNLVLNSIETPLTNRIEICADVCQVTGKERNLAPPGEQLPAGAYLRIKVSDNGSGMPPEVAERAFEPFFSTKFLGRGLGLAEVLGIMRAHQGTVQLETVPDGGTSVALLFPSGQLTVPVAA